MSPFHLAIPVKDLESTASFYGSVLGCKTGRQTDEWIDFDFFGHQLSAHVKPHELRAAAANQVDGKDVPVRHFGVVLPWDDWHQLAERLKKSEMKFHIEPYIRFRGKLGEQATMFFSDPSGNMLEFKSFRDPSQLFASAS